MTSVLNLLLPLNGSKYILIALTGMLLVMTGCRNTKPVAGNQPVTEPRDPRDSGVVGKDPIDSIPYVIPDSLLTGDIFTYKDTYQVALILPLFLDKYESVNKSDTLVIPDNLDKKEIFKPAILGLEYYQGVRLALDSLKAKGLKVKLHVFDGYDDNQVKKLVNSGALLDKDLMLGPIYNSHIKIVAPFAMQKRIPMFSPLSPSGDLVNMNDMYIMVNPTLDVHIENMFQLVADSFAKQNLNILYLDEPGEYKYVESLHLMANQYNIGLQQTLNLNEKPFKPDTTKKKGFMKFEEIPVVRNQETKLPQLGKLELKQYLDHEKNNIFVLPTVDMAVIQMVTKELFAYAADYQITVIGTPAWGNDDNLRMDYIDAMDVYFTAPYHLDSAYFASTFRSNFVKEFSTEPSATTLKAYDLTRYLGNLMLNYGTSYYYMMQVDEKNSWHSGFKFRNQMVMDTITRELLTDHMENKFVHILRYKNQQLIKLN